MNSKPEISAIPQGPASHFVDGQKRSKTGCLHLLFTTKMVQTPKSVKSNSGSESWLLLLSSPPAFAPPSPTPPPTSFPAQKASAQAVRKPAHAVQRPQPQPPPPSSCVRTRILETSVRDQRKALVAVSSSDLDRPEEGKNRKKNIGGFT